MIIEPKPPLMTWEKYYDILQKQNKKVDRQLKYYKNKLEKLNIKGEKE